LASRACCSLANSAVSCSIRKKSKPARCSSLAIGRGLEASAAPTGARAEAHCRSAREGTAGLGRRFAGRDRLNWRRGSVGKDARGATPYVKADRRRSGKATMPAAPTPAQPGDAPCVFT
jgi:hypothetical protein